MDTYWVNQYGNTLKLKPKTATLHGAYLSRTDLAAWHSKYPNETVCDRALRLGMIDSWMFAAKLVFTANKNLYYFGEAGKKVARAFNSYIYGK
jgi:hypothetical protein